MEITPIKSVKAVIKTASFVKEYESKFGMLYQHKITYDDKIAYYLSKKKEQTEFIPGKESEFVEEEKQGQNGTYFVIKLPPKAGRSNYVKEVKKEQSRYSGFAVSYCKDLIIAGKLELKDWEPASKKIFNFMVELDKSLEK